MSWFISSGGLRVKWMAFHTGGNILPLVPRIIETKGRDPVRAQRAAVQDIHELVEKKLAQMLASNPTRMDYYTPSAGG